VNADRRARSPTVLVLASLVGVLAAAALAAALVLEPPRLAWVGFAVLSLVVLALGIAGTLAVPRLRVSPPPPAVAVDRTQRLLVVADAVCSPAALADEIRARLSDAVAVHVVVPVRVSHLHFLTNDEVLERRQAESDLARAIRLLDERGIFATGAVGDDKPLESMTDALGNFAATHVLLAIPPERESYWLERELLPKARALTAVEVGLVILPSSKTESGASDV
jgi:GABA permease